ncbi:RDD family protein [Primorskyibacter sp. S187A]|uniref:RDD family protein n=1 Tax=Primorskyibacter sp. S187A TaxID=3415130 RepID=UPI003C7BAD65
MHTAALPDPSYQPEFYASVTPKRGIAWIIDTIFILALCVVILPFTAFTALFFFPFFYLVIGFAYRTVTIANGSATLGMRMMSIELRDAMGHKLTLGGAFLHTLGYTISIGIFLVQVASIVLMMASDRGQSLTDMALGTVMLNRRV